MNDFFTLANTDCPDNIEKYEMIELIYVIVAWKKLSSTKNIDEKLTYNYYFNRKKESENLFCIFDELAKEFELFKIYELDQSKFGDFVLSKIFFIINSNPIFPSVYDTFFLSEYKIETLLISDQITKLGVKFLENTRPYGSETYIPFTNGFSYVKYLMGDVYVDNHSAKYSLIVELLNILEERKITFKLTNALVSPKYLDVNDSNNLKEFRSVLSFPPYGLKQELDIQGDKFKRFKFQKGSVLDVAHFEHILSQTKYKAVVLMPVGFTYRIGSEEEFRKYLIEKNYLKAIIQLPPNLHSATSVETTFFIIDKRRKEDNKVMFINLKDERFIKREGRQLVLNSIDDIVDIYKNTKELENISKVVSKEEIVNNNYSFAIDRYVITKKAKEFQKILETFTLVNLENIADIKRSQLFKDEEKGLEIYEISPSDFNGAGFTLECGKIKKIELQEKRLNTYKLEAYDVLLSTKGTIGKVAIIGEISNSVVASQAIQVIRIQEIGKKEMAIALYMFFKSDLGQAVLGQLVAGTAMPQIATTEIKKLRIPLFSKDEQNELFLNFNNEIDLFNEINNIKVNIRQLHNSFLSKDN